MGWAAIIGLLIEILGPILKEWILNWINNHLKRVAASLPAPATFATPQLANDALMDAAISAAPRFAFARRGILRWMKRKGPAPTLTAEDFAELRDLSEAADNE